MSHRATTSTSVTGNPKAATFRLGDDIEMPAELVSLPTVVETHKSLDGITFYKTGLATNMVVVGEPSPQSGAERRDGITPPACNIKRRKWRRRPPRQMKEVEQVAMELEALQRGGPPKPEFELIEEVC